jgi:hypothetical protein
VSAEAAVVMRFLALESVVRGSIAVAATEPHRLDGAQPIRTSRRESRHDLEAVVGAIDDDLGDRDVELRP